MYIIFKVPSVLTKYYSHKLIFELNIGSCKLPKDLHSLNSQLFERRVPPIRTFLFKLKSMKFKCTFLGVTSFIQSISSFILVVRINERRYEINTIIGMCCCPKTFTSSLLEASSCRSRCIFNYQVYRIIRLLLILRDAQTN